MTRAKAPFIGFTVSPETHAWLQRCAREGGDFDADAAARRLIEALCADDALAEAEAVPVSSTDREAGR